MKKTLLAGLALALALPLSAQPGPPPGGGPGQQGPPPEVVLKEALGLSDTQLQQLRTLLDTRRQAGEALQAQIRDAERALGEALQATSPDPTTVGTKLLALHALQKQRRTIDEAFRSGFDAMLTTEQKAKIEAWETLEASLRALGALRGIGY